ncbi:MAG: FkbM family methyltransferase [Crocosphaera sp.]|nr:FkbM family methyltransferase [Crocosphaera sp.]
MKRVIKQIINKFGYDIVRTDRITKKPLTDMKEFLHNDHPIIFDVGANVGQSIENFRGVFPKCTIHSFEPSPRTFEILKQKAPKLENLYLWNYALGSSCKSMNFLENSSSTMSSFLPISEYGWGKVIKETLVEVKTIDQFCEDKGIEHIDILKSDTQGFDLEVFKGAEKTIQANKIGLIYFEIIFSDMYKNLPSFSEIYDFLISRDFLLVTFYKFHYQKNLASWTDALFVHNSYIQ